MRKPEDKAPGIVVFPAQSEDIADLVPLFDAYRMFYEQPSDITAAAAYVKKELATANTRFFLARNSEGLAVGFVHLIPSTNTLAMRPIWYLEDLFVHPAGRRQGTATALLVAAERFARESGAERLTLSTAHDNQAAQSLYRKLGYVREEHFWYFHRLLL